MADISKYLEDIKKAIYGEEVRGSIHDAIEAMNTEAASAMEFAAGAKDSAKASAAEAKSSADNAEAAEDNAARMAASASAKAAEALVSAGEAKTAETGAAASASTASTKAAEALDSAGKAKTAETNAKTAAANAQTAQTNAQTAQTSAAASASTASAKAEEAAQSERSARQYSGNPPKPQNGSWWIWNAGKQAYEDSGISCELAGPAGNGVRDIRLTQGSHAPGSTDIYTVTMTDGSTYPLAVYNGRDGEGAGDVLGIFFTLTLPAAGWSDRTLTALDSRLLPLPEYLYLIAADPACRQEYVRCMVRPGDVTAQGRLTFQYGVSPQTDLTVWVLRLELPANDT